MLKSESRSSAVKVCDKCSNVSIDLLKSIVPEDQLKIHCLGHCEGHDGKFFGIIKGELIIEDTEESFFEQVKAQI